MQRKMNRGVIMLINYIGAFIVMILGLYIMMSKKNLIKIVIGMSLVDSGLNLLDPVVLHLYLLQI